MLALVIYGMRTKHRAQTTYVPVDAIIVSQRLIEHHDTYEPRVEYEFVIDGVTHTCDNVWAGPDDSYSLWLKDAEQTLDQFPVGQKVQAFYDPDQPDQAYLLANPLAFGEFGGYFFLFFCAVAIVVLFSIAWNMELVWELVAAHIGTLLAASLWLMLILRGERE